MRYEVAEVAEGMFTVERVTEAGREWDDRFEVWGSREEAEAELYAAERAAFRFRGATGYSATGMLHFLGDFRWTAACGAGIVRGSGADRAQCRNCIRVMDAL